MQKLYPLMPKIHISHVFVLFFRPNADDAQRTNAISRCFELFSIFFALMLTMHSKHITIDRAYAVMLTLPKKSRFSRIF